ncbi:MAG: ABC transporter ATP-binding protein [Acidobacteriia bacterium]|nr:ABC transporter ATP-binding protein [Terriglobia bacterium]
MILAQEVTKFFGRHRALNRVSFEIHPGEVVGLIGPNGAGKTTLLSALMGFLRIQSGVIQVLGQSVSCGISPEGAFFVPDTPAFYGFYSARDHLRLSSRLLGKRVEKRRMTDILDQVGLAQDADRKVSDYSRGMIQRLAWGVAMLTQPSVLILDEPTSALDPLGVIQLRSVVHQFSSAGAAILFSSHSLGEVERACERVLFLSHGELSGPVPSDSNPLSHFEAKLPPHVMIDLGCLGDFAEEISQQGQYLRFGVRGSPSIAEVARWLEDRGIKTVSLADISQSMERSFVQYLNKDDE